MIASILRRVKKIEQRTPSTSMYETTSQRVWSLFGFAAKANGWDEGEQKWQVGHGISLAVASRGRGRAQKYNKVLNALRNMKAFALANPFLLSICCREPLSVLPVAINAPQSI
jgi:hypothetical protein